MGGFAEADPLEGVLGDGGGFLGPALWGGAACSWRSPTGGPPRSHPSRANGREAKREPLLTPAVYTFTTENFWGTVEL